VAQRGVFHCQLGQHGGSTSAIGVDLNAVLEVALEVAEAVSYMHSIRLCHGDIKVGWWGGWWSDCLPSSSWLPCNH
jgi:hypothetical protein